jgi:hypothetical protein
MGLATAQAFAQASAAVTLFDLNAEKLNAATEWLGSAGHRVIGIVGDVSDEVQKTVSATANISMPSGASTYDLAKPLPVKVRMTPAFRSHTTRALKKPFYRLQTRVY